MQIDRISLINTHQLNPLITAYVEGNNSLSPFVNAFANSASLGHKISTKTMPLESRELLRNILLVQNKNISLLPQSGAAIDSLLSPKTFTITTGHQLCLFTGPMYFVFKILSAIKLAKQLKQQFPDNNFVPVYWMASEDHDVEEINHAYVNGKKIEWPTAQTGAVGSFTLENISECVAQFTSALGPGANAMAIAELIRTSYSKPTLADATRHLVNELFGQFGVVIIDGNDKALKGHFSSYIKEELTSQKSFKAIEKTSKKIEELGFKTQINPREVNLFYLEPNSRKRIEKTSEHQWKLADNSKVWEEKELLEEVDLHPEHFSPNVAMRPLYQEVALPNIACVGGPGELSYWLQLKESFDAYGVDFPVLILRDSALIISNKNSLRIDKLGLSNSDLFKSKNELVKRIVGSDNISLEEEKNELRKIFETISAKAKQSDATLEATALAELQKQLQGLDTLEKRFLKALKVKSDVRLQQLDKLMEELLPGGALNERRDNYFQYQAEYGEQWINNLLDAMDPLACELKIFRE
jgi:bacillithiol biosynthesis cysteine-adding enzyme BshC